MVFLFLAVSYQQSAVSRYRLRFGDSIYLMTHGGYCYDLDASGESAINQEGGSCDPFGIVGSEENGGAPDVSR